MAPRLGAAVAWLLAGVSLVSWAWWGLRPRPQAVVAPPAATAIAGDLSPLLGPPQAAAGAVVPNSPALASRIRLLGLVAPREGAGGQSRGGVALLAVDGRPPRPYRVGGKLDGELVLQMVGRRTATIGTLDGTPRLKLELPEIKLSSPGAVPDPASRAITAPLPPPLRGVPVNTDPEAAERQAPGPNDPVPATLAPDNDPQRQIGPDSAR